MKRHISLLAAMLLLASAGLALAAHGKAGLWNVSTTMAAPNIQMPPEALAQMKAMGMKMPGGQTVTTQICMTQAEVDSDKPPQMQRNDAGCTSNITSKSASGMTAEMVCNGQMQGAGHIEIAYSGTGHYEGSYTFKGAMQGRPVETSSSFKGDWLQADCGAVKPYSPK
ncbi:MAG TPA: DUF3617 domain-containing protein [Rhizomicrobium sp.]|nr:DUF3617 domain-containing protein [Rhizomicrobium sp.]